MGISEASNPDDVRGRPMVRARAIESLRTALQTAPTIQPDHREQHSGPETQQASSDKKRDIAVAMVLAREAVATAARAAEDELRHMQELLDNSEERETEPEPPAE